MIILIRLNQVELAQTSSSRFWQVPTCSPHLRWACSGFQPSSSSVSIPEPRPEVSRFLCEPRRVRSWSECTPETEKRCLEKKSWRYFWNKTISGYLSEPLGLLQLELKMVATLRQSFEKESMTFFTKIIKFFQLFYSLLHETKTFNAHDVMFFPLHSSATSHISSELERKKLGFEPLTSAHKKFPLMTCPWLQRRIILNTT